MWCHVTCIVLSCDCQVLGSAILQQVFVVEFVVHHQMCDECHRRQAQDFWRAVVQIRQKVREWEREKCACLSAFYILSCVDINRM